MLPDAIAEVIDHYELRQDYRTMVDINKYFRNINANINISKMFYEIKYF